VSVGHIARALEQSGIATVVICSGVFRDRVQAMSLPRTLFTHNIFGRPMGRPGDKKTQLRILNAALDLFESAEEGNTVVDFV